jgi:hypothetical protein
MLEEKNEGGFGGEPPDRGDLDGQRSDLKFQAEGLLIKLRRITAEIETIASHLRAEGEAGQEPAAEAEGHGASPSSAADRPHRSEPRRFKRFWLLHI